jgi:sugar phosphate isomerase/epimerase
VQTLVGCFNRPWNQYTLEDSLRGIADAGFKYFGLLTQHRTTLVSADSTPDEMDALRQKIESYGLTPLITIASPKMDVSVDEAVELMRRQFHAAARLGCKYVITGGTSKEAEYEKWFDIMRKAAPAAGAAGVQIVLKPHGGISATAKELALCCERIDSPHFAIWYDPGNIVYYNNQSPEDDVRELVAAIPAHRITGVCVKDCAGGLHGEVMITPTTGVVDFRRVFSTLFEAGVQGPFVVECLSNKTLEETNAAAKQTQVWLRRLLVDIGWNAE